MADEAALELARRRLRHFARRCWSIVETEVYQSNWHIDAICEHLEALYLGQIRNLLIMMPPRHMKSLLVSVMFPAWVWLQDQGARFLLASYAHTLALRDSVKSRRIIQSPLYAELMRPKCPDFTLVSDQNTKGRYDSNKGGYRIATSVGGAATGEGGDYVGVDDAHNVIEGESPAKRREAVTWWKESMSTRLSNPKTGRRLLIGQRVHHDDTLGNVIADDEERGDWTILCLPAEYEVGDTRTKTIINFTDPRRVEGELLWKERFGRTEVEHLKNELGSYAAAAQLQQRPHPRSGGLFNVDNLRVVDFVSGTIEKDVRYWDKAGTEGGGAASAGVRLVKVTSCLDYDYIFIDVVRGHWAPGKRNAIMLTTAQADGVGTTIYTEQEPGSGGKESAINSVQELSGFSAHGIPSTGSKETRAEPLASQMEIGRVAVLKRPWTALFTSELRAFPTGKYRDQVDAASGAFNAIHVKKTISAGSPFSRN